jgi:hypothetical protein
VTEFALERLFEENDVTALYISGNHNPVHPTYFFAIGSLHPERWPQIADQGETVRASLDRTRMFRPLGKQGRVLM